MNILEQIVADKRVEIAERMQVHPIVELLEKLPRVEARPDFLTALHSGAIGLIAEVKRRSPSAGLIRDPFDPVAIAKSYEANGANAVSCLMDHAYFGGGDDDFSSVRKAIELPMLYKEFVVDSWQIAHAKVMGASAVLLIVGVLTNQELCGFMKEIRALGLLPLVEVHDLEEMQRAIDAGANCIGINNRNLMTFITTLDTTFELMSRVPSECTIISESGIKTPEDVARLKEAGVDAILVGESLLKEADPGAAAARLMSLI